MKHENSISGSSTIKSRAPKRKKTTKKKSSLKVGELKLDLKCSVGPLILCGDTVKDTISGFSGVVTAVCYYLDGTSRVEVTAKTKKDDARWLSDTRLKVTKKAYPHIKG